eukprot:307385_1
MALLLIRRFALSNKCVAEINSITSVRYFAYSHNSKQKNQHKKQSHSKEKMANDDTDEYGPMKSKVNKEKMANDRMFHQTETRKKIQSPSAYQHAKNEVRKCSNEEQVWQTVLKYQKCEDVQFGTAAMQQITLFLKKRQISASCAMDKVDMIWDLMEQYVIGMNVVAYTEYFNVCNITGFDWKCRVVFDQMVDNKIMPDSILLHKLLKTCLQSGGVKAALYYWEIIVIKMDVIPSPECWAAFISVCAKKEEVELAEQIFGECPYKNIFVVVLRMMEVYKNVGNVAKVLELREHIEKKQIIMKIQKEDKKDEVHNTIAAVYTIQKQWKHALAVTENAISMKEYNMKTVTHLLKALIGTLKSTDDIHKRKEILQYIESNVENYYKEFGDHGLNYVKSIEHSNRMLDAYVSTYPGFGSVTFEEFCQKYNVQYWDHDDKTKIPMLNLYAYNYSVSKAILNYVFEKKIKEFCNLGLYIVINEDFQHKHKNTVSKEEITSMISSLISSPIVIRKKKGLLFISAEQTLQCIDDSDEPLFS